MKVEKSIDEINERIREGSVCVVTADEMSELVEEKGAEEAAREVDVVTTGTFGAMCSSGVFLNFGHSDPPIKMHRVWLNEVEAYTGIAAVDAYLGAAQPSEDRGIEYGGGHVIEDLVAGKTVELRAIGFGTDCYPRKEIETEISLDDLNTATMLNPRNAYQRYSAATNSSDRTLYTYMGTLLPDMRNATFCGAGSLSPLFNDPDFETIGVGTRIFLCGGEGFIVGEGTQHDPANNKATLMVCGDLRGMRKEFLRGATFYGYGATLYVGIGIPIPVLNERIAAKTGIKDEEIMTEVHDYGVPRRDKPVLAKVSYAELKSGRIEIAGKEVKTSPLSSFYMAKKVATELKRWIERGEFFLTKPVKRLRREAVLKPMPQKEEIPLVKDVLRKTFATIGGDASIEDAAKLIFQTGTTHIPVVTREGKLQGIVTAWDIAKAVAKKHRKLAEIMTRKVITARMDEPIDAVVRKMERHNISALPVVDAERKVIGMVTSDDISKLLKKGRKWLRLRI
ncbi:MAG: Sulfur incorporation enzyme MA1821 [Methanophagales archaeon]|nr:CBS domain-containing protein [Methanophagales archaeon]MCU4139621.1 Sulfur incorporation enzyme MA1821 [Methanophagales archaeon]